MTSTMFRAFAKEAMALQLEDRDTPPDYVSVKAAVMQKLGMGNLGLATSIGGLGVLGRPAYHELRGKPMDEKQKAKHELVGLGMIAGPEVHELAKGSKGHIGKLVSRLKGAAGKVRA